MVLLVKHNFDSELANKKYTSREAATNAGNSWKRDCTVDQNIRKGRWFEIVEIKE